MKFSEFANMIYPYDKEGKTKSGFVLYLIDQIMEAPLTEKDKQKEANDEYNPLDKLSISTLEKIFNGSRNINKRRAQIIRAHLDKDKFDTYITEFNNNAMESFCATLKENGVSINDNQVSLACADTFENILTDLVNGTSKQSSDNYSKGFMDGIDKTEEVVSKHRILPRKSPSFVTPHKISVSCGAPTSKISVNCGAPTPIILASLCA